MQRSVQWSIYAMFVAGLFFSVLAAHAADDTAVSGARLGGGINNAYKDGQVGVGLQVGGLTGATIEYWLTESTALNFSVTSERGNLGIGLAHNWMFRDAFASSGGGRVAQYFVPYIGVGALMAFGTTSDYFTRTGQSTALAAQLPLGVSYLPWPQRFGIFAEIAPSVELAPQLEGFLSADLGARFYF